MNTETDFRIAKRDEAIARAEQAERMAAQGGDAYYDAAAYRVMAARSRAFAAWVDEKIRNFPKAA